VSHARQIANWVHCVENGAAAVEDAVNIGYPRPSKLGVRYPLAHSLPLIGPGKRLLLEVQEEVGLPGEYWLVAVADGQPTLTPPSETFTERVEWSDEIAAAWRPAADAASPVRMRPDERFALPAVGGVKTEVLWEHLEADETFDDVAGEFDLTSTRSAGSIYEAVRGAPLDPRNFHRKITGTAGFVEANDDIAPRWPPGPALPARTSRDLVPAAPAHPPIRRDAMRPCHRPTGARQATPSKHLCAEPAYIRRWCGCRWRPRPRRPLGVGPLDGNTGHGSGLSLIASPVELTR
jgi:hypothetical protein